MSLKYESMSLKYEPASEPLHINSHRKETALRRALKKVCPRDLYFIAEQPAPVPHLAHPEGCAALRIVPVTVPRVSRTCEHFPDGFDLPLLQVCPKGYRGTSLIRPPPP